MENTGMNGGNELEVYRDGSMADIRNFDLTGRDGGAYSADRKKKPPGGIRGGPFQLSEAPTRAYSFRTTFPV